MIKNNQIMILGTGLSGMGSLKLANKMGINVFISDSKKISSETKKYFYKNDIEFVTIYLEAKSTNEGFKQRILKEIVWPIYGLSYYHPIWKTLNVGTFPYYILIDKELNIESIPALGPIPNGVYETIDKTFHELLNK